MLPLALPCLSVLEDVVLEKVEIPLARTGPGVAVDRVAAVADHRVLQAAPEPEVDQAEDGEREAEGPGDERGSHGHQGAAQGAIEVALPVEVPAAAKKADLDVCLGTVRPTLARHLTDGATLRAWELSRRSRRGGLDDGAERKPAGAALSPDPHAAHTGTPVVTLR